MYSNSNFWTDLKSKINLKVVNDVIMIALNLSVLVAVIYFIRWYIEERKRLKNVNKYWESQNKYWESQPISEAQEDNEPEPLSKSAPQATQAINTGIVPPLSVKSSEIAQKAKQIRREGEPYKDAYKRAKVILTNHYTTNDDSNNGE